MGTIVYSINKCLFIKLYEYSLIWKDEEERNLESNK